ncbi:probable CCR4-associated factor 1 homolog 11 [Olea europaea var. sylvestris]|uniref:poly(A)-specific ribonuclease n=1 Tax=Olea europaea subsp. europaea TaxID=158383 RepID=A0A8S0RRK1_OLEEU|nr:probable CCR4-associated factor 1 homolog 11 [Olea europaea var. sylvestris]CAA2981870.1 probable CCR4-associated factor 1 homolog 11 [Olea europaea subsp. europaea]
MVRPIKVRQVWQYNLKYEFSLISQVLRRFPYASMDTEFPGVIYHHPVLHYSALSASQTYSIMKKNVDDMKLIQFGLTLSDAEGNLPDFGTPYCYVWEFNFCEFDVDKDLQNPDSIALLKRQGIDFSKNKKIGIHAFHFATLFMASGLSVAPTWVNQNRTWVTFHSTYDFGFLVKILSQQKLPNDLSRFLQLVRLYFGTKVFDMKQIMGLHQVHGGLERVAKSLNVERMAGKSHQAGSDSLLMMQTFIQLKKIYFNGPRKELLSGFSCKLHGLATN